MLALRIEESLDAFAAEHHIGRADAERTIQSGLERTIHEAEVAGDLPGFVASLIARAVDPLPPWRVLETLASLRAFFPE